MDAKNKEEWFRKFYEGTFLVKGWKARMQEILHKIPADKQEHVRELLDNLGRQIGTEWAKDNNVRRIDSSMLKQWGKDLREAGDKGADDLIEKIHAISKEADDLTA